MADTQGAAWALARFGQTPRIISARGVVGRDLEALPVAALRLAPEVAAGLAKLGMETVGELERTPRAPLALRFGPELTCRLDQAHGRQGRPSNP